MVGSAYLFNRYVPPAKPTYERLLQLLANKDYFVLTTNVDHCFQRAGFNHERLFYTQGDYGLWQCSLPCHNATYDNEATVRRMVDEQNDMRVPAELVPNCLKCGSPMSMNLRADATFVEDEGWHEAASQFDRYMRAIFSEDSDAIFPFSEKENDHPEGNDSDSLSKSVSHRETKTSGTNRVLLLELGVGMNTPGIIKIPFWQRNTRM